VLQENRRTARFVHGVPRGLGTPCEHDITKQLEKGERIMANTAAAKHEIKAELATPERTRGGVAFTPRVDIVETSDELLLYADLPGVRPDDLDVRFENGELIVHGKCAPRNENANFLLAEYGLGDFYRAFSISESIDASRIVANLKHGVLTVHLPKTEKAKPKRIAIKAE
jgi:HSP20 family protein